MNSLKVDFDALCKDFAARKPQEPPVSMAPFATIPWDNGDASSNDLLRRYLIDNSISYINDFNGTVWFLHDGNWTRCRVHCDRSQDGTPIIARFLRCIFEIEIG